MDESVKNQGFEQKKKIINTIKQGFGLGEIVVDGSKTFEELGINSVEFVGMVVICEKEFGIQYEDKMLLMDVFENFDAFVDYINSLCETG